VVATDGVPFTSNVGKESTNPSGAHGPVALPAKLTSNVPVALGANIQADRTELLLC
jgi:hypothetical protein